MSEEENKGEEGKEQTQPNLSPEKTNEPVLNKDEIIAQVKADIEASLPKTFSQDDVEKLIQKQTKETNQRLAEALGVAPKSDDKALTKALLTDTEGFLSMFGEALYEKWDSKHSARNAEKDAYEKSMQSENARMHKERPDIMQDDNTLEIFNEFFGNTNPEDSVEERVKQATKKTDLLLEKAGRGTAKERIAAASSVTSQGGSREPYKQEQAGSPSDLPEKYISDRLARRKAQLAV